MKKFLTTLAVLGVFATPAFAQSFDPDTGTGNVLTFARTSAAAPQNERIAERPSADCILSPWFRDPARP